MKNKVLLSILMLGTACLSLGACDLSSFINIVDGGDDEEHIDPPENEGVVRLNSSISCRDYDPMYTPLGDVKVLIVPIEFPSGSGVRGTWDQATLNNINRYFFSTTDKGSFVSYYKTMSYGKIYFSGMVASPYHTTKKPSDFSNDPYSNKLYAFLKDALDSVTSDGSVDWREYDKNNDGYFDAIHFLTNYDATEWGSSLWPHQSMSHLNPGTHSKPSYNNYSLSSLYVQNKLMQDSLTQIHEQGHLFGLDDYYNYTESSNADYVGNFDMQGGVNMFDWNAYSKCVVGLADPYVVDGSKDECTVTIKDLATSGDCLIIPANYSTFNKTVFDEYFMVQLFSKKGLNSVYWSNLSGYDMLPDSGFGVLIYHVDARIYNYSRNKFEDASKWNPSSYNYHAACNNSYNYQDYYGADECGNFTLLNLVQASGNNTHLNNSNWISQDDFFYKGDTFSWNTAKKFLLKSGNNATSMNKGEAFPWSVEFTEMSRDSVTMKITKNS